MSEPTCRVCWLATLPATERQRVAAEAVTSCVHLCADHQAAMDAVMRNLPPLSLIKARSPAHREHYDLCEIVPVERDS